MTNEEKHKAIVQKLYERYEQLENDINEFTWDGPPNWRLWNSTYPRIMFLAKESRNEFQPSTPGQPVNNKFIRNIARWKIAIESAIVERTMKPFPSNNDLPAINDELCIVEVKKLNEENVASSNRKIEAYAERDKDLLKEQINTINPHIVLCCYTFEPYDIIYERTYSVEKNLITVERCSCWLLDNRLVIDFFHPSTHNISHEDPNHRDIELYEILSKIMVSPEVQSKIPQLLI